jgi:hypothetical protein
MKEFIESQKRISKITSVANEREVRLIDVEGKPTKSKKTSKTRSKDNSDNSDPTTGKAPSKLNNLEKVAKEGPPTKLG